MKFIKDDSATKLIRTNGPWLVIILWPQCAKSEEDKYIRPQNSRQRIRRVHRPVENLLSSNKLNASIQLRSTAYWKQLSDC